MRYLKPRHLLLVVAAVLALCLLVVIAVRFRPGDAVQTVAKALPKGIDVALEDIDYSHVEEGRARWRLVARQVERSGDSGRILVARPQLSFFSADGETVAAVSANRGDVSSDYKQVSMLGDVVLTQPDGYTLKTDRLDYDHVSRTAVSEGHVLIEKEGVRLEGEGLKVDLEQKRFQLQRRVRGVFESGAM
jgi:LPS export ABC transporter protein LptC